MGKKSNDSGRQPAKRRRAAAIAAMFGAFVVLVALLLAIAPASASRQRANANSSGWTAVFSETFESGIGSDWTVLDLDGATNGEYYWATTNYTSSEGTSSAWATGGGADGSGLTPGVDDYPNGALSAMTHDAVDLSSYNAARLLFDYWLDTDAGFDVLQVSVSDDGTNFDAVTTLDGNSGGWQSTELDLGAYAGTSTVWVRFFFSSNGVTTAKGAFVDNVYLEGRSEQQLYLPLIRMEPPPPYFYFDDFSNPNSGWPIVDNTHVSNDCFKWYYSNEQTYRSDICDDRTDVKVSPGIDLPEGSYEIEVDGRFRESVGWWTSYGILFDAKDDPRPEKPDLGDYYMLWILWEGSNKHKWKILEDIPGDQKDVTKWSILADSVYDYGNNGTNWNTWRIVRTADEISIYVNDHHLRTVSRSRPTTNFQTLFGVFVSTYETDRNRVAFDNYLITAADGSAAPIFVGPSQGIVRSGPFELEEHLPKVDFEFGR